MLPKDFKDVVRTFRCARLGGSKDPHYITVNIFFRE
jgi:hypothetical protein